MRLNQLPNARVVYKGTHGYMLVLHVPCALQVSMGRLTRPKRENHDPSW